MRHHGLHEFRAEAPAAEFRQHEHVLQVRERGAIGDDAGKCDLGAAQRWRRMPRAVLRQAHDFYQYANLGDGSCLTQTGVLPGEIYSASLADCVASQPADQLIAFWFASV